MKNVIRQNYQAKFPIVVVNSVDFARYFSWTIGIRYIGFSNLKTFMVFPPYVQRRNLRHVSPAMSLGRSTLQDSLTTVVSPTLIMAVQP